MTSFNIGSLQASTVNNVGGDQTIHGGQHVIAGAPPEVLQAARDLLTALIGADLDPAVRTGVVAEAHALGRDLAGKDADRSWVARRLTGVVSALQTAGHAVGAIAALAGPVTTIARWLGPLGAPILAML